MQAGDRVTNIVLVGVGGQNVTRTAILIAEAAMCAGFDVRESEIHGLSQRGGSLVVYIRFGRRVMSSIIGEGEADFLVAMEQYEALRHLRFLRSRGLLVLSDVRLPLAFVSEEADSALASHLKEYHRRVLFVETRRIARQSRSSRVGHIALVGALASRLPLAPEHWETALKRRVPPEDRDKALVALRTATERYGRKSKPSHQPA